MSEEPVAKRPRIGGLSFDLSEFRSLSSSAERVRALKPLEGATLDAFIAAGGLSLLGEWLSDALADVGCQLGVLAVLEKIPMTIDLLRTSLLGRTLNELVRKATNSVISTKGMKILSSWKSLVPTTAAPAASVPGRRLPAPVHQLPAAVTPVAAKAAAPAPAASAVGAAGKAFTAAKASAPSPASSAPEGGSSIFDELAAFAETLGSSLSGPLPAKKPKKRLKWREEADIAEVREFSVEDAPLEVSSARSLAHSMHSHEHGQLEAVGMRSFAEIRRKERRSGGQGLRNGGQDQRDLDDEICAALGPAPAPAPPGAVGSRQPAGTGGFAAAYAVPRWSLLPPECQYVFRAVKSYEKQDLADLHGSRAEIFYPDATPSDPQDMSSSSAFAAALAASGNFRTVEVRLRGLPEVTALVAGPGIGTGTGTGFSGDGQGGTGSFADEFVKLDSEVQRLIMGSENLLKFFKENPAMLRGLTLETINRDAATTAPLHAAAQPSGTPQGAAMGGGISGIASAIKSHARANVQSRRAGFRGGMHSQPQQQHPPPPPPPFGGFPRFYRGGFHQQH